MTKIIVGLVALSLLACGHPPAPCNVGAIKCSDDKSAVLSCGGDGTWGVESCSPGRSCAYAAKLGLDSGLIYTVAECR